MRQWQLIERFALVKMPSTFQAQSCSTKRRYIAIIEHHRILWTILYLGNGCLNVITTIRMFYLNSSTSPYQIGVFDHLIGDGGRAQALFIGDFTFYVAHNFAYLGFAESTFILSTYLRANRQKWRIVNLLNVRAFNGKRNETRNCKSVQWGDVAIKRNDIANAGGFSAVCQWLVIDCVTLAITTALFDLVWLSDCGCWYYYYSM